MPNPETSASSENSPVSWGLRLGVSLMLFFFCLYAAAVGLSFLYLSSAWLSLGAASCGFAALIRSSGLAFVFGKRRRFLLASFLFPYLVFIFSAWVAQLTVDIGHDSQSTYESLAVLMNQGWNPIWNGILQLQSQTWAINTYPKALFWIGGIFYGIFQNIGTIKAGQLILAVCVFCFGTGFLLRLRLVDKPRAVLIGALITLNPIFLVQWPTLYVDAAGYFVGVICGLLLCLYLIENNKAWLWLLAAFYAIAINIKATTTLYMTLFGLSGIFFIQFSGPAFAYAKRERIRLLLKSGIIGAIVGFLILGFNPFVWNLIQRGNPIPFFSHFIIKSKPQPFPWEDKAFVPRNSFRNFYLSYFSVSRNTLPDEGPTKLTCKDFFHVSQSELQVFSVPDATIGGFGPYYGFALILALFAVGWITWKDPRRRRFFFFIWGTLWVTVLVCPITWWARFIPLAWLLPCIPLVFILSHPERSRLKSVLTLGLLTVLALNLVFVFVPNITHQISQTQAIQRQNDLLREASKIKPVRLFFTDFANQRFRFKENGIQFVTSSPVMVSDPTEDRDAECRDRIPVIGANGTEICLAQDMPQRDEWVERLKAASVTNSIVDSGQIYEYFTFFGFKFLNRDTVPLRSYPSLICPPLFGGTWISK